MNEHFMNTVKTLSNRLLNPLGWFWICSFLLTSLNCYATWLFIFEVQWSEIAQLCPTLCDPIDCSLPGSSCPWDFPGKNTGVGCHFLLQEIFPTPGLNLGLLHCRQTRYRLSHQGSLIHIYHVHICLHTTLKEYTSEHKHWKSIQVNINSM